jgi:hypothetical protein
LENAGERIMYARSLNFEVRKYIKGYWEDSKACVSLYKEGEEVD